MTKPSICKATKRWSKSIKVAPARAVVAFASKSSIAADYIMGVKRDA